MNYNQYKGANSANKLSPDPDEMFDILNVHYVIGNIQVYEDDISIESIQPFDKAFHPQARPDGDLLMDEMFKMFNDGRAPRLSLYPKEGAFIFGDRSSIDYLVYEAALIKKFSTLPCRIFGDPGTRDIQVVVDALDNTKANDQPTPNSRVNKK